MTDQMELISYRILAALEQCHQNVGHDRRVSLKDDMRLMMMRLQACARGDLAVVTVADAVNSVTGWAFVDPASCHPSLHKANAAELLDVYVLPSARGKGLGASLIAQAEHITQSQFNLAALGLCVAMFPSFGAAHRLYARLGYAPDGCGLWSAKTQKPLLIQASLTLDETVVMCWLKALGREARA